MEEAGGIAIRRAVIDVARQRIGRAAQNAVPHVRGLLLGLRIIGVVAGAVADVALHRPAPVASHPQALAVECSDSTRRSPRCSISNALDDLREVGLALRPLRPPSWRSHTRETASPAITAMIAITIRSSTA